MKKYIVLAMLFLLIGCGQSSNGNADISEKINDYLAITPYLPQTDYEIGTVIIQHSPQIENGEMTKGKPFTASISYHVSQNEKVDEAFLEAWEKEHQFEEIIYGDLFMDQTAIIVTVAPGGIGELGHAELIEIENHHVQYQYIEREPETVFILINFDDVGYQIQYSAGSSNIEEAAKAFAAEIIINH